MGKIQIISTEDYYLLEKIKDGSKEAFDLLFQKYWDTAYCEAYKRLKNQADSEDIVQDVFTKIWMNREKQCIDNFPAYLYVSIRNNVIKLISRKKLTHPYFDILENLPQKDCAADANLLWNEFFRWYEALLNAMPPKRQEIFRLRFNDNLSTKDIAIQLGIARKTVQNQLGKAIESLKIPLHMSVVGLIILIHIS